MIGKCLNVTNVVSGTSGFLTEFSERFLLRLALDCYLCLRFPLNQLKIDSIGSVEINNNHERDNFDVKCKFTYLFADKWFLWNEIFLRILGTTCLGSSEKFHSSETIYQQLGR